MGLVLGFPVLQVLGELCHLPLEFLDIHPLKGLQALPGGGQLLLDGLIVGKGLLGRLHIPLVLRQDGIHHLPRQGLVPHLEILQELCFHLLLSFLFLGIKKAPGWVLMG